MMCDYPIAKVDSHGSNECRGQSRSLYIKQIEFKQPVTMAFPEIVVVFAVIAMCAAAPSDRKLIMIIITIDQHKTNTSKYTLFMIIQKYLNSNQQFFDFSEMIDTEQRKIYTKSLYGCT